MKQAGFARVTKRSLDVFIAVVALVVAAPLMVMTALLVWVTMGRPILFVQGRPGLHGRCFPLFKFRTMRQVHDKNGNPLPDAARLTVAGRLLRSTSIDELPQLLNVLSGDLSLVGPRPLLPSYLNRYSAEQARRHEVMPGITGWAQVNGRNAISWEQKFELDVWYVDHWSLALDLRILWMSLAKVLRRDGVSSDGHVTMPEFMGDGHEKGPR